MMRRRAHNTCRAPRVLRVSPLLAVTCATVAATAAIVRAAPGAGGVPSSDATPPILVLESHVGDPPAEVDERLDPLLDELERRGLGARPATIARMLGDRAPRPGILDRGITAQDLAARSLAGLEAYRSGAYRDAAVTLSRVVADLERNPAVLSLDATNASTVVRAYVGLALSQDGLGDHEGSIATMIELLRTCANPMIDYAEYGPQAETLLGAARRASRKLGRGQLAISVDEASMIVIDNELRATGHNTVADLIPGRFRILVHVPRVGSRQYHVDVRADHRTTLEVTWSIDAALVVGDTWTGLVFASEADRIREAAYAGALAQRWGHTAIAVIATTLLHGEPGVIATMYRADGSVVRRAGVAIHGSQALRALGRFLADGTPSTDLEIFGPQDSIGDPAVDRLTSRSAAAEPGVPGWPFVITGVVGITAGAVAVALDQDHGNRDAAGHLTAYYRDSAPLGVAACALGAAAVAYGVWQWVSPRRQSMPTVSISGHRASIGWAASF
jgi:hypothetical protein